MASTAGKDFFFTQFMRSHGLLLDIAISCIFSSKKILFAKWTFVLNSFQYWMSPDVRYLFKLSEHSVFHHSLECLVIRLSFELFIQAWSKIVFSCWTEFSRPSFVPMFDVSKFLTPVIIEDMKFFFSSLSFLMDHLLMSMLVPWMPTSTVIGTWSDGLRISGWCHDLAKQLSHYLIFLFFFFFFSSSFEYCFSFSFSFF